jgi:alpha-tubulin suppressor-like RCC1 family protein
MLPLKLSGSLTKKKLCSSNEEHSTPQKISVIHEETKNINMAGVAPVTTTASNNVTVNTVNMSKINVNMKSHGGQLFTWGRATSGQLGQSNFLHPRNSGCCAMPHPVPSMAHVTSVACGGLDEGFTVVSTSSGKVYTFGKDLFGRLGHGDRGRAALIVTSPRLVKDIPFTVICVAAGTEHAACLTNEGHMWSWGRNIGGCLGRGTSSSRSKKNVCIDVQPMINRDTKKDDCNDRSLPALVHDIGHGRSSWIGTHYGRLPEDGTLKRTVLANVIKIDCEYHYSGALLSDGRLLLWGTNSHGQLGVGDLVDRHLPNQVKSLNNIIEFSLGTRYAAAVTKTGKLYTWGDGTHGNLGLGDNKSRLIPDQVVGNNLDLQMIIKVSCSRTQGWQNGGAGQQSILRNQKPNTRILKKKLKSKVLKTAIGTRKRGGGKEAKKTMLPQKIRLPKLSSETISPGGEGGHTCCITSTGKMYTFGTAHNGVLANLGRKTNALDQDWNENRPFLVGSTLRDSLQIQSSLIPHEPMSPFACWPNYDGCGSFVDVIASHDHCMVINNKGELWGWGNGSDGRVGVERFLNMSGEKKNGKSGQAKPPVMDRCKCIMMGPHRVGIARKEYWPGGKSLKDYHVLQIASGRNHMACIAELKGTSNFTEKPVENVFNSVQPPWHPVGERVGYNDVTPPVKYIFKP